jgi:hypothetical protein
MLEFDHVSEALELTLRDQLLHQAMSLSLSDQAYLVRSLEDHLISQVPQESLESDTSDGASLLEELRRRSATYRSRHSSARSAESIMADLRLRQSSERAS